MKNIWLEPEIFAVYMAHKIRRYTRATDKEDALRLFCDDKSLSVDHVRDVWDGHAEPSPELLAAVNAKHGVTKKNLYMFLR